MKVGTKSVLFGAHCFFLHPWFVAAAWWKLFGFPKDVRLWVAFFVHDIGYIGKPNMDGAEGESHVETGGVIMDTLFGEQWGDFSVYHSRFWAKKFGVAPSRLCVADKLAFCLTPAWIYLPMVRATGEIREYMKLAEAMNAGAGGGKYATMNISTRDQKTWHRDVCDYLRRWVDEHKDGRDDTWTPAQKQAKTDTGVGSMEVTAELLFGDDFPSLTLNNSVAPEEAPRLSKQCREILERLKQGPATNRELSQISLKYTGRISDLRASGFRIEIVERNHQSGLNVYELKTSAASACGGSRPTNLAPES